MEPVEVHVEAFAVLQKYLDTLPRDADTERPPIRDCVAVAPYSYEEGARSTHIRARISQHAYRSTRIRARISLAKDPGGTFVARGDALQSAAPL